jgi:uncharacterized membrane protein YeaQ/YmgE (transglycosylase-associated protein family)
MVITVGGWVVFGFVVGLLARFLLPGKQKMGWITTTLLGILGSLLGAAGMAAYNGATIQSIQDLSGAGFLSSLGGALVLLLGGTLVKGRSSSK